MQIGDIKAVTRNEKTLTVETSKVSAKSKKIGGLKFLTPVVPVGKLADAITFLGEEDVRGLFNTFLRRFSLNAWIDSMGEDGSVDLDKWLQKILNISSAGEGLGALREKIVELQDRSNLLLMGGTDEGGTEYAKLFDFDQDSEEFIARKDELQKLNLEIKDLKIKESELSAEYQERAKTRAANKAKKKAEEEAKGQLNPPDEEAEGEVTETN